MPRVAAGGLVAFTEDQQHDPEGPPRLAGRPQVTPGGCSRPWPRPAARFARAPPSPRLLRFGAPGHGCLKTPGAVAPGESAAVGGRRGVGARGGRAAEDAKGGGGEADAGGAAGCEGRALPRGPPFSTQLVPTRVPRTQALLEPARRRPLAGVVSPPLDPRRIRGKRLRGGAGFCQE